MELGKQWNIELKWKFIHIGNWNVLVVLAKWEEITTHFKKNYSCHTDMTSRNFKDRWDFFKEFESRIIEKLWSRVLGCLKTTVFERGNLFTHRNTIKENGIFLRSILWPANFQVLFWNIKYLLVYKIYVLLLLRKFKI